MKINIKEFMFVIILVVFGASSIIYAAPTVVAPGGNIDRPIHTINTTSSPTPQTQSKMGTNMIRYLVGNGIYINGPLGLVFRALTLGNSVPPADDSNTTVKVVGMAQIGTLASSTDSLNILGSSTEIGVTTLFKTTASSGDGKVIINHTGNGDIKNACLNSSNYVVAC